MLRTPSSRSLRAAVFDLDGVITDTARLHALAWKELIDGYLELRNWRHGESNSPFDPHRDYREYVDGKPRAQGLWSFLEARGIRVPFGDPDDPPDRETVCGLAHRKDQLFQEVLAREPVDVVAGTVTLVRALRDRGVRVAVASSSRNCRGILERAGLTDLFEARVDGVTLRELGLSGKPDPDMFVEAARRIEADPADAAVFEDAVSGVQAGRRGAFGLVVGVAPDASARASLRSAGAHLLWEAQRMGGLEVDLLEAWFAQAEHRLPNPLEDWPGFQHALAGQDPAIFLDYDGTLSPIVDRPDEALLSPETRQAVQRLAQRHATTIVSGRGRGDVAELVGLDELYYAGSHGYDISGPHQGRDGLRIEHRAAEEVAPVMEEVTARLQHDLADVSGAIVEPKRYTVAVHYRMVADDEREVVEQAVDRAVEGHSQVKKTHGKKVFEIRPDMEWDKGKAVLWLLEALELDRDDVVPIYVGDDTTDEDAFRALKGKGIGVLVASAPRATSAHYAVQDTEEVRGFLERLASL